MQFTLTKTGLLDFGPSQPFTLTIPVSLISLSREKSTLFFNRYAHAIDEHPVLAVSIIQAQILMLWLPLMPSGSQSCPFSAAPDRAGHPPPEGWNKIKFDKRVISYCTWQNWRRRTKKSWRAQPWLLNRTIHKIYKLKLQIIRNPATTVKTTKHFRSGMYFALYFLMVLSGVKYWYDIPTAGLGAW